MKKCPYCAEEIQDEAILCRYCGKDQRIPPEPVASSPPSKAQAKQPALCEFCGTVHQVEWSLEKGWGCWEKSAAMNEENAITRAHFSAFEKAAREGMLFKNSLEKELPWEDRSRLTWTRACGHLQFSPDSIERMGMPFLNFPGFTSCGTCPMWGRGPGRATSKREVDINLSLSMEARAALPPGFRLYELQCESCGETWLLGMKGLRL